MDGVVFVFVFVFGFVFVFVFVFVFSVCVCVCVCGGVFSLQYRTIERVPKPAQPLTIQICHTADTQTHTSQNCGTQLWCLLPLRYHTADLYRSPMPPTHPGGL